MFYMQKRAQGLRALFALLQIASIAAEQLFGKFPAVASVFRGPAQVGIPRDAVGRKALPFHPLIKRQALISVVFHIVADLFHPGAKALQIAFHQRIPAREAALDHSARSTELQIQLLPIHPFHQIHHGQQLGRPAQVPPGLGGVYPARPAVGQLMNRLQPLFSVVNIPGIRQGRVENVQLLAAGSCSGNQGEALFVITMGPKSISGGAPTFQVVSGQKRVPGPKQRRGELPFAHHNRPPRQVKQHKGPGDQPIFCALLVLLQGYGRSPSLRFLRSGSDKPPAPARPERYHGSTSRRRNRR